MQLRRRLTLASLLFTLANGSPIVDKGGVKGNFFQNLLTKGFSKSSPRESFKCIGHGFQSKRESCKTFYYCIDLSDEGIGWLAFKFICPRGMVFDSQRKECFSFAHWKLRVPPCLGGNQPKQPLYQEAGTSPVNAQVVTTYPPSVECRHASDDSFIVTSLRGYQEGVQIMASRTAKSCEIVRNTTDYLNRINSFKQVPLHDGDTILYNNISAIYNSDLDSFKSHQSLWYGSARILDLLQEIFVLVRNFEMGFTRVLWNSNDMIRWQKHNFSAVSKEQQLIEITEHIKPCFNSSESRHLAMPVMAFNFRRDNRQLHTLNSSIKKNRVLKSPDKITPQLEKVFEYAIASASEIYNKTMVARAIVSISKSNGLLKDFENISKHRRKVLETIIIFEKEKSEYEKRKAKLKHDISKFEAMMAEEFSYISSLRDEAKKSVGQDILKQILIPKHNPIAGMSSIYHGFKSIKFLSEIYDMDKPFSEDIHVPRQIKAKISRHENQIKVLFNILKRPRNELALVEGNINDLETELSHYKILDSDTERLMRDSGEFMHLVATISTVLSDVEKVFGTIITDFKGFTPKEESFSNIRQSIVRLRLRMSIQDLKWSWHQFANRVIHFGGGDCILS